ncbi:hypothetical protein ACIQCD_13525 [Streptomyces sp. NPDC093250]|uniref:hypothetical protein n=1 Tax=Streptomyces sp. NPDC093250 TaxID=3366036 RepID=UPI0037FFACA6
MQADTGVYDIYLRDRRTGRRARISVGLDGGRPTSAAPSADGRTIAFQYRGDDLVGPGSASAQLVPDDTNGPRDGFVRRLR